MASHDIQSASRLFIRLFTYPDNSRRGGFSVLELADLRSSLDLRVPMMIVTELETKSLVLSSFTNYQYSLYPLHSLPYIFLCPAL